MMRTIGALICCVFAISGCSLYSIDSEEVTTNFYTSKTADNQVEYVETITRPHEVIGFVTVNAERNQKMPEIMARIRHEAAVIGGDAFTNITTNASGSWKKVPPQRLLKNAYIRANYSATVVIYKDTAEAKETPKPEEKK